MSTETIIRSDVTGKPVGEADRVSVVIYTHPLLEGAVELDAGIKEVESLATAGIDFVVLRIVSNGESSEQIAVSLPNFEAMFQVDPREAIKSARPFKRTVAKAADNGGELALIRAWAIQKGYEVKAKGRISAQIVEEYHSEQRAA